VKYLKLFESNSPQDILKDSLSELCDEREVIFDTSNYSAIPRNSITGLSQNMILIKVGVKLEKYYPCEIDRNFTSTSFDLFQESINEIRDISKLIDEGVIRSKIELDSYSFRFCDGKKYAISSLTNSKPSDYWMMYTMFLTDVTEL
jgi:hypothetical protein